jgi:general secretion pathway protein E
MLLVTGPTGSGKTTTLYAALTEIHNGREKIITIEDPVEYQLPGILQIPVNEKKGLTFAKGLRSILRHDPTRSWSARSATARPPRSRCSRR